MVTDKIEKNLLISKYKKKINELEKRIKKLEKLKKDKKNIKRKKGDEILSNIAKFKDAYKMF